MKKAVCVLFLSILLIGIVIAAELPPQPMTIRGNVTDSNGTLIPNGGYYITIKIGTALSGECGIVNGLYGKGDEPCKIISPTGSYSKMEFFIGDIKLGEDYFESGKDIKLNFVVSSLPTNFTQLSNGVCEPAKGECDYNTVDCDASKTTLCAENGKCDSNIGETCSLTPGDCGVCQTSSGSSGGSSSSSSSGGGGGGGGGGGASTTKTTNLVTLSTNNSDVEENETVDLSDTENSGITGNAISDFTRTTGGKASIAVLVLVILIVTFYFISRRKK